MKAVVVIVWLCLIINSTCGHAEITELNTEAGLSSGLNSTNELEPTFGTWKDFQIRHIVSIDQGSVANWNAYFRRQMPSQYGNKSVNTFIVNSANSISKNFPLDVPQYTGGSANNLYWSSTAQRQFVLTLTGGPSPNYNVYDCGQQYFVAGLDMTTRLPVHYQGHSSSQGPRIDQIIAGCTKVAIGQDLFSQVDVLIFLGILIGTIISLSVVWFLIKKCRGRHNDDVVNERSTLIGNIDNCASGECCQITLLCACAQVLCAIPVIL